MATFRKKRSRKYKRRNTRRNRRSKKSLVGGVQEEYKNPEEPEISLFFSPKDLIQAITKIISNRGSNEQYFRATNFIRNMKANIVIYTGQFKKTLNNNIRSGDERDKAALISSFEPHLKIVKTNLDQLYKSTILNGNLSPKDEAFIIEEAREIGIDYYTAMLTSLRDIFDIH
jgi:hypothetical protein